MHTPWNHNCIVKTSNTPPKTSPFIVPASYTSTLLPPPSDYYGSAFCWKRLICFFFFFKRVLYKRNHIVCTSFVWLTELSIIIFEIHPCWCRYQHSISFYCWAVFYCMDMTDCSLIYLWIFELFPIWDYFKWKFQEYSHARFCFCTRFLFSWINT